MENYYKVLGVNPAATAEEIRRAYRILARRYHPDVNPGKTSEERFKLIAQAYSVLSDPARRKAFDAEIDRLGRETFSNTFERAHQAYRRQQTRSDAAAADAARDSARRRAADGHSSAQSGSAHGSATYARRRSRSSPGQKVDTDTQRFIRLTKAAFASLKRSIKPDRFRPSTSPEQEHPGSEQTTEEPTVVSQISLIEVSVSVFDAIRGVKKTVEISDGTPTQATTPPKIPQSRKISVTIPPGVRTGSVIRFRRKENPAEEVVLIVRIAAHPLLNVTHKGVIVQVPISVSEAILGAKIQVPTLDEPATIAIEPGSQSGIEIRLKARGVHFRDGSRGDLFYKLMIVVPDSPQAVGLKDRCDELEQYYPRPVRHGLPKNLLEP